MPHHDGIRWPKMFAGQSGGGDINRRRAGSRQVFSADAAHLLTGGEDEVHLAGWALLARGQHPRGFEKRSHRCAVVHEMAAEVVTELDKGLLASSGAHSGAGTDARS